jgi:3-oxoacyl-[acyl-carrier protein] reductase
MELKNAKVLVTGGSSGIGLETAKELIKNGAKVAITGRDKSKLLKIAAEIGAEPIWADASNETEAIAMVKTVIEKFGSFNVLINNAAYGTFGNLVDIDTKKFMDLFATNVIGAMLAGRESAKHFIANNYGNIINISSTAGNAGFAGGTTYVASKFALKGMTECWRAELRKHNIRVMLVNPSEVQTNFLPNAGLQLRPENDTKLEAQEISHLIISMLTMRDRGFITEATVFATNPQ